MRSDALTAIHLAKSVVAFLIGAGAGMLLGTRFERRLYRFLGVEPSVVLRVFSALLAGYFVLRLVNKWFPHVRNSASDKEGR